MYIYPLKIKNIVLLLYYCTRNASILSLVAMHKKKQQMN